MGITDSPERDGAGGNRLPNRSRSRRKALKSRKQLNYKPALRLILKDMPFVPLDDPDQWIEDASEVYSGVKHADNELPEPIFLANTLKTNLLVLRYWIAGRLGCSMTVLESRLAIEPHSQPYVPV